MRFKLSTLPDKAGFPHLSAEFLLNALPFPCYLISRERKVLALNNSARSFGASKGDDCWCAVHMMMAAQEEAAGEPLRHSSCIFCRAQSPLQSDVAVHDEVAAHGRVWELWWVPLGGESGAYLHYALDITQHKRTEESLLHLNNLYAALSRTNQAIITINDRQQLFREVCRIAVENGRFKLAWIGMVDEATLQLNPVASYGDAVDYMRDINISIDDSRPEGKGLTGTAAREQRNVVCNDFLNSPQTQPWREAALASGIRSTAVFLLKQQGEMTGALKVYSDQLNFFNDALIALMEEMAANISFALDNYAREEQRLRAEEALQRHVESLRYLSTHDSMTGLYNRAYFETELERLGKGRHFPVSVIVADIDGLKGANDLHGHMAGDALIREAARGLSCSVRADDIVARIGGDEFAVLLPEADAATAEQVLSRIAAFKGGGEASCPVSLSLSLGMATAQCGETLAEALKSADRIMYRNKFNKGGSRDRLPSNADVTPTPA
jgi:diguanylate cyclase (GGDEF)-like protein